MKFTPIPDKNTKKYRNHWILSQCDKINTPYPKARILLSVETVDVFVKVKNDTIKQDKTIRPVRI